MARSRLRRERSERGQSGAGQNVFSQTRGKIQDMNKILYTIERKLNRIAVPNLMKYVVIGMILLFILPFLFPRPITVLGIEPTISELFILDRTAILAGQVWRIVTFIFLPPQSSPFFIIISLYFYYFLGNSLEYKWGTSRFNLYYLIGMLGSIIAAMIIGYGTNTYLNYSLFFAFAAIFPNEEFRLFFVIPIKIKYLAYFNAAFFVFSFIVGTWGERAAILASLLNFFLFFGEDLFTKLKVKSRTYSTRRNFKKNMK